MFRFEHPEHLYFLALIPILIILFIGVILMRKRDINKLGERAIINQLMPGLSKYKYILKFSLLVLAFGFLCVAYANPQWGTKKEKVKRKSADIFIALDVSESMLCEDVRPSRMERAKQFMQKLIEELKGERIGTIVFAGNAYLQMPLTTDYSAAQLFIKSASPKMVPSQGTAIGDAIELAMQSFEGDNKHHKALVIITDGENHEEKAVEMAKEAAEKGMLIFTVGVGTANGGPIPVSSFGRKDYKRDRNKNIVVSKLNETMLRNLSQSANGKYYNMSSQESVIESLQSRIERLEKQEFEQRSFSDYESQYQYLLAIGLLLLIIEFLLAYRKSDWLGKRDIFKV